MSAQRVCGAVGMVRSLVAAAACTGLQVPTQATTTATTRNYYIAADEGTRAFAPSGTNQVTGQPVGDEEALWVKSGPHRIGRVYKKALYREYTDGTFAQLKPRAPEWEHLGFLGPLIRGEVGDTIKI